MSSPDNIARFSSLTDEGLTDLVSTPIDREIWQTELGASFYLDAARDWLKRELDDSPSIYSVDPADTNRIYFSAKLQAQNADNGRANRQIIRPKDRYLNLRFDPNDSLLDPTEKISPLITNALSIANNREIIAIDDPIAQINRANSRDNPAFNLIGLTQLRKDPQFAGIDGSGVSVAVIDTGIDADHPLIAPNYLTGYDFVDRDNDPDDTEGHGTHISGIIGAVDETIGVATDVGLIGLRAFDDHGNGSLSRIEDALRWVSQNRQQHNIVALNLSFGFGSFTSESEAWLYGSVISDELRRLEDAGVTVVASTGNNYYTNSALKESANVAFPAISSTLAVGAVWQDGTESNASWGKGSIDYSTEADRIASFSQRLNSPNMIFAPGVAIASTLPGGDIGEDSGTSQAAPHISGAVALLQEASLQFGDRLLTSEEVTEILRTTGEPIFDGDDEDDNVNNTYSSYIRVDIYNAVSEVKRRSNGIVPSSENTIYPRLEDRNGTMAGAYSLPNLDGSKLNPIRGTIGGDGINSYDNDVDLFSFQLESPGKVNIEVTSDFSDPDNFDSYLRLFDDSGNQIAANNNISTNNLFSRLDLNLDRGIYYIGVSGNNNTDYDPNEANSGTGGDTGNYGLELDFTEYSSDEIAKIYRFFRPDLGVHFYTASKVERDSIDDNLPQYVYEGESFISASNTTDSLSGAKPVYRFFNISTGAHLYTISQTEREHISNNLANYSFEGVAYYGYQSQSDRPGAVPLYRFYNPLIDAHFYTPSTVERDTVLANLPDYRFEGDNGIAFYVEPIVEAFCTPCAT